MAIWYESDPSTLIPLDEALSVWASAAPEILIGYASTPWRYATYTEFAGDLFKTTGLRTNRPLQQWPGQVLGMVLDHCQDNGLPALSSLVVSQRSGTCGVGFGTWHRKVRKEPTTEKARERLAAILRTECYQRYAGVPEGAEPFHTPIYLGLLEGEERSRSG